MVAAFVDRAVGVGAEAQRAAVGDDRRVIGFDLDGTLVDSVADIARALNAALATKDLAPHPVVDVRAFVGDGARMLVVRGLAARGVTGDDVVDETLKAFRAAYGQDPVGMTLPFDGIVAAIDALAAHRLVVLTNKPGIFARPIVEALFPGRFELVVGPDDLGVQKPNPASLAQVAARVGAAVEVFVGDGDTDVDVAAAAGIPSVGVTWGLKPEDARRATAVVETVADLPAAIERLLSAQR